ncbi:unknown [Porphyromonas sp. CAG:1061]|nr:unknown [Porphyromonas sp. CAG:1061]
MKNSLSCTRVSLMLMSMFFVINSHFTKIALLGLTHFFGTVSEIIGELATHSFYLNFGEVQQIYRAILFCWEIISFYPYA